MGPETSNKAKASKKSASAQPALSSPIPAAHSHKRNTALIASVIALIVLIGVFVLLWFTVFSKPGKADYETALNAAKEVRASYTDLSSKTEQSLSVSTGQSADELYEQLNDSFTAYKEASEKLEGLKAFNDDEAGKVYRAFSEKDAQFVAAVQSLVDSYKPFVELRTACDDSMTSGSSGFGSDDAVEKFDAAVKNCRAAIESAIDMPNEHMKALAERMDTFFTDLRAAYVKVVESYKDKDYSAYSSAVGELRTVTSNFSKDAGEISNALTDSLNEVDIKEQLNDLGKTLTNKVNS